MVEQLIRNQQVDGSIPPAGSTNTKGLQAFSLQSLFFIFGHYIGILGHIQAFLRNNCVILA